MAYREFWRKIDALCFLDDLERGGEKPELTDRHPIFADDMPSPDDEPRWIVEW